MKNSSNLNEKSGLLYIIYINIYIYNIYKYIYIYIYIFMFGFLDFSGPIKWEHRPQMG